MHIVPLHDEVVVRVITPEQWRNSKLWVPKTTAYDSHTLVTGEVVAVGEGRITERGELCDMHVKVGEIVLWPYFQCYFMEIDDVKYAVTTDKQIVGKLEGEGMRARLIDPQGQGLTDRPLDNVN